MTTGRNAGGGNNAAGGERRAKMHHPPRGILPVADDQAIPGPGHGPRADQRRIVVGRLGQGQAAQQGARLITQRQAGVAAIGQKEPAVER